LVLPDRKFPSVKLEKENVSGYICVLSILIYAHRIFNWP